MSVSSKAIVGHSVSRVLNSSGLFLALAFSALVLAGCDSAEERAEEHYQAGMELLEKGDVDRALIEFRNVFKLDDTHMEARLAFARVQRERGNNGDAYGQYRRLVEQYPNNFEGQLALAEMALDFNNVEDLQRYSAKAVELEPTNIKAQSLSNTANYFQAIKDRDTDGQRKAVESATQLISEDGDLPGARKILIDDLIRQQQWEEALTQLGEAIRISPNDLALYRLKLGLLQQLGDTSAVRQELETMNEKFPNNAEIKQALVSYYVAQDDLDAAEAFLRAEAEASDDVDITRRLVAFMLRFRSPDAAMAELDRVIETERLSPLPFEGMRARLKFDQGDRDAAIARLEELTANIPEGEQTDMTRSLQVELARMYFQTGNPVEARRLVETVLAEDASNPEASKLKAAWLIQDDETQDAILLLREAMGNAPNDAALMTLMAQAYEREGNRELMAEMLSLAVDASNNAPTETLRYAQYLVSNDQSRTAESIIIESLRAEPTNKELLVALGNIYIGTENWSQSQGVINRLQELDNEEATASALSLQARSLAAQNRSSELMQMLEGVAENPGTQKAAEIAIFRTRLATDGAEAALEYINGLLENAPEDPDFRYLKAGSLVALERQDEAEAIYRELTEEHPENARTWVTLYRLNRLTGDDEAASETLNSAIEANPEDPALLITLAEQLQADNEIEQAIEIYDGLYQRNTNNVIVANNLASLLSDYREDEDSLQKAYSVARRLRGAEIPAFQDTYGWIAYRMGETEESLPYLRAAAEGLSQDPMVQYHYGQALATAGENEAAMEQLNKTAEMLQEANRPELLSTVEGVLEELRNSASE